MIIDQEQTIEKFRELVRHLQGDILELRERGESQQPEGGAREGIGGSASPVMSLNVQMKSSAIKAHSRVRQQPFCHFFSSSSLSLSQLLSLYTHLQQS